MPWGTEANAGTGTSQKLNQKNIGWRLANLPSRPSGTLDGTQRRTWTKVAADHLVQASNWPQARLGLHSQHRCLGKGSLIGGRRHCMQRQAHVPLSRQMGPISSLCSGASQSNKPLLVSINPTYNVLNPKPEVSVFGK